MIDFGGETVLTEVLEAHRRILDADDKHSAINDALMRIGTVAAADRVYIFEITSGEGDEAYASQRYEWCSSRVEAQIENPDLQKIPLREAGYRRWLDSLESSTPIVGNVRDFPPDEHPLLESQGILSIVVLPIFAESRLWGFVGFDDCTHGRDWTAVEVDLLITLAFALGITLSGSRDAALEYATERYLALVDRLLQVNTVTFSETSARSIALRTEVRVRVLVSSYRYFARNRDVEEVPVSDYLEALQPLFSEIGACEDVVERCLALVDAGDLHLDINRCLDIAIILAEVLAAIADRFGRTFTGADVTIALHGVETRVELAVTARDKHGVPLGDGALLDGMALALLRHVQERLGARILPARYEGLLFRLTFPLHVAEKLSPAR